MKGRGGDGVAPGWEVTGEDILVTAGQGRLDGASSASPLGSDWQIREREVEGQLRGGAVVWKEG